MRSFPLSPEDKEDVAAQVLLKIVEHDYAALRQFRGKSSLAAYLTVIARRTCVNELASRAVIKDKEGAGKSHEHAVNVAEKANTKPKAGGQELLEEVAKLLKKLPSREARWCGYFTSKADRTKKSAPNLIFPSTASAPFWRGHAEAARRRLNLAHPLLAAFG